MAVTERSQAPSVNAMCLILIALRSHPKYKLIIAGNRDEYHDRSTAQAAFWEDAPGVLAGKDLRAGGTWFGITKKGRIAAVTNYRDPALIRSHPPSRGKLVRGFLLSQQGPTDYLKRLAQEAGNYSGFNLIIGDPDDLYWYSNIGSGPHKLTCNIYGLSNHLLDTPWPKVTRSKNAFQKLLFEQKDPLAEDIFAILFDKSKADDESLPDTGIGTECERLLSSIFICSPTYGTRSSTLLLVDLHDRVTFIERTFDVDPSHVITTEYEFPIEHDT